MQSEVENLLFRMTQMASDASTVRSRPYPFRLITPVLSVPFSGLRKASPNSIPGRDRNAAAKLQTVPLNKLGHTSNSLAHNGKPKMSLKCCYTAVPISTVSSPSETYKTEMHPSDLLCFGNGKIEKTTHENLKPERFASSIAQSNLVA